jgi:PAS domain S-box-containing protein
MTKRNPFTQRWRALGITHKFTLAFGALLALIILVALTGYAALTVVQSQTEAAILTAMEVQRLVLKMDSGLQSARRFERDFFLRWPAVGFAEAEETYAQGNSNQIAEVVSLSAELQQLISQPDVSQALQEANVNLNFYLSAANRYAATFDEAVALVADLAVDETGAQARLAQNSALLLERLQQANDPQLVVLYREMQAHEKDYLVTRQRPNMQLAFNAIRPLREAIDNTSGFDAGQRTEALAQLDAYQAVAEEVLKLDVDIRSKFNEFDLQAEAVDPISAELIELAGDEVQQAREQIARTSQLAKIVLAVAVVAAVALAGVIAWVLGNSITRNIVKLTEAAIELQGDNLDARAEVDSADELGQLADSFNAMAARIKTLVGDLEGQVAMAQARLGQAIESISEGFALYDETDHLVLANQKYHQMLSEITHLIVPGVHFKQLLRVGAERGLYPDAEGGAESWIEERLAQHHQPEAPFEQPLKDGRWLRISESKTPAGESVGIYTDITQRRQAEEELRKFSRAVEQSASSVMITDTSGAIEYVNPRFSHLTGYTLDEVVGQNPRILKSGKTASGEYQQLWQVITAGGEWQGEFLNQKKNGELFWVSTSISPIRDTGSDITHFLAIQEDITERKRTEEALRQQNEYLAALHETALGLISRLDLNELLHTLVTRAGHLLGAPYGFVYLVEPGSTVMELKVVVGLTDQQVGQQHRLGEGLVGRVWQASQPLLIDDYDAWPGRSEDVGAGVIRAIVGVPLTHQAGEGQYNPEVVGVIGLAFGRESERRFGEHEVEVLTRFAQLASIALDNARLYSEAQQARQAAEAANQAKSDFLASVSHELRTPLTSVLGFAKLSKQSLERKLLPKIQADDRRTKRDIRFVSENMEIIVAEGERLTTLINNVLDLAKIEAGKVDWDMQPLAIAEVIERATAATAALFEQKGLQLIKNLPSDLPEVVGDQDKLIQVVINLIANAIKFTTEGSVTCRAEAANNQVVVSVIDTGTGIAPEDQAQVFEKFKQVGDTLTDKPQGTGLGLPICKEIVEHHGGRIWVESALGRGSTFSFALPVQWADFETESTPEPVELTTLVKQFKQHIATTTPNGDDRPKTVLVVDDEEPIRKLLKQALTEAGYRVNEAISGQEALLQIRREKPDLVILDVLMPNMNGFSVAAILKNDPQTMDLPIIMLTIVEDAERGYRLGVDRYLNKPINSEALFADIEGLLTRKSGPRNVLIVDEDAATIKTLAEIFQEKGYQVSEARTAAEFVEKAVSATPDIILVNAKFSEQGNAARTTRFDQGLDNVVMLFYQ